MTARSLLAALALLVAAPVLAQPKPTPDQLAAQVLKTTPLVDGHNDWPWALRTAYGVAGAQAADLMADPSTRTPPGHTSIPWLRQGRLGAQIWSVYVPASYPAAAATQATFEQIDIVKSFVARYPETFALVTTADQLEAAFRSGRIASLIGIEGANQIGDDIDTLRRAARAGVRAMTLTHSRTTSLFDSATGDVKYRGMAPGAGAMIAEMNRLGVLVDLSHVSPQVMHQVLDVTAAPVIFSHSSARALTDHPRNVPDDVLARMPANGGIVMVTFVPAFVNQARADWQARRQAQALVAGQGEAGKAAMAAWDAANPKPVSTLAMVADHVEHVAKIAGHAHVGIGGDYDGVDDLPQGLETVATYPALFAELARRGWTESRLRALAGTNFLRVLRANEAVAARLQAQAAPTATAP
jgi:membrane dipeptidase